MENSLDIWPRCCSSARSSTSAAAGSETLAGLAGPGRDERWERIDIHATALTGGLLILVIIGAWLVEVALLRWRS